MTDTKPFTQAPNTEDPQIEATVVKRGTGPVVGRLIVDDDISVFEGRTEDGVRREIISAVAQIAAELSRPVRFTARDSLGLQTIAVSPDGYTEALTPLLRDDDDEQDAPAHGSRHAEVSASFGPTAAAPAAPPTSSSSVSAISTAPRTIDDFEALLRPGRVNLPGGATAPVPPAVPVDHSDAVAAPALSAPEGFDEDAEDDAPMADPFSALIDAAPAAPAPVTTPVPVAAPASAASVASGADASAAGARNAPSHREASGSASGPRAADPGVLPTLADFMAGRPEGTPGPAEMGWQGAIRRLTGGLIKPSPGGAERAHREAVASVQRSFDGPRTIVVVNPKGGAHKTTATLLLAATFGLHRGGYALAWDNNETRGTLGWRAPQAPHQNTAVGLLHDLPRFDDPARSRVGDLDGYVRSQGSAQFDVLASDEDPAATDLIDADAFRRLHATLARFYRVLVVDTGNNMRAENWGAAVEAADQLVIVSTVREDTAASAAWLVDGLREKGFGDKVKSAVTVLSAPAQEPDAQLSRRLHGHFGSLTRAVVDVPHDPGLVDGGSVDFAALSKNTKEAWLHAAATVSAGL